MVRLLLLLVVACLACSAVLAWAEDTHPSARVDRKWLRMELAKARGKYQLPALGAAVVTSKGAVLVEVVGVRKKGDETRATNEDLFHLGSDTKALTALLIAVLVHNKQLSFDLTLEKAFPELGEKLHSDYRKVTLEQILAHQAGLPANFPGGWWAVPRKPSLREQRQEVASRVLSKKPSAEPGTKFLYSNVGYTLAGHIAERTGKLSWEELMQKHIFGPLKMTTAGMGAPGSADKVDQPWPHAEEGKPIKPGPTADNPPVMSPAGRAHASLADWSRFVADQLKGAQGKDGLLPAAAYRKLHAPLPRDGKYTPGGWLYVRGGGSILTHDGSNTMNHCTAVLVPKADVAVLVVTNQGGKKAQEGTHAVREAVLGKVFGVKE